LNLHGLRVIDFHAHFPISWRRGWRERLVEIYGEGKADKILENRFMYREEWRKTWGFSPAEEHTNTDEEQAERWALDISSKGVERANFVMGGGNDRLASIISKHPDKFTGFAHHNIWQEDAPEEIERAVKKLGLKGFKLIASSQEQPIEDKKLYPVWDKISELGIPTIIHFGVLGGGGGPARDLHNMNPLSLWPVASDYPEIDFIIPHFGACYIRELLELCWNAPNVSVDTSGSNQWMRWMPYQLTIKDLFRKCVETIGADRIIFGTDSSYFPRGFSEPYLREQVKACYEIGLTSTQIEKIFYKNATRLLKID
jgi:predicted TIM-barrel fold metal-dependent hydrolase